eukprot:gene7972-9478_t
MRDGTSERGMPVRKPSALSVEGGGCSDDRDVLELRSGNDTCAELGHHTITDVAECEAAASTLGKEDQSVSEVLATSSPYGCYYYQGASNGLMLNGEGSSTVGRTADRWPLCLSGMYVGCYRNLTEQFQQGPMDIGYDPESCMKACGGFSYYALWDDGWCGCSEVPPGGAQSHNNECGRDCYTGTTTCDGDAGSYFENRAVYMRGSPVEGICTDSCSFAGDQECDDGGSGSRHSLCEYGTDCIDCHSRTPLQDPGVEREAARTAP